jgi:hypothetical protein
MERVFDKSDLVTLSFVGDLHLPPAKAIAPPHLREHTATAAI